MNRIRIASQAEVDTIKDKADLDQGCIVMALDSQRGTGLAVRRICNEIDPMICPEEWDMKLRAMFMRDLETVMMAQGVSHYYFNVNVADEKWQHVLKTWGAEEVSKEPAFRYKRTL